MKNLILAASFFAAVTSINATTELDIECSAPNLNYLNRFQIEQTIEAETTDNDNIWTVTAFTLMPVITKAGNNAQSQEVELEVSGTLTKIESQMTKNPYYNLKLFSADKKVFANLNLDFPSNLSSSIRTREGRVYKAKCKLLK